MEQKKKKKNILSLLMKDHSSVDFTFFCVWLTETDKNQKPRKYVENWMLMDFFAV